MPIFFSSNSSAVPQLTVERVCLGTIKVSLRVWILMMGSWGRNLTRLQRVWGSPLRQKKRRSRHGPFTSTGETRVLLCMACMHIFISLAFLAEVFLRLWNASKHTVLDKCSDSIQQLYFNTSSKGCTSTGGCPWLKGLNCLSDVAGIEPSRTKITNSLDGHLESRLGSLLW